MSAMEPAMGSGGLGRGGVFRDFVKYKNLKAPLTHGLAMENRSVYRSQKLASRRDSSPP